MIDEDDESEFNSRATLRRARSNAAHRRGRRAVTPPERAALEGADSGFEPSYKSDDEHGERQSIIDALAAPYHDHLIDDVLSMIKGGKEATVYLCRAHASTGRAFFAAKIYRPRKQRSLKNDALYREGRGVTDSSGKALLARDRRVQRAVQNMTTFGAELRIGSWIAHEHTTLRLLHAAGADVPRPHALAHQAIVMDYLGDAELTAPTLNHVTLEPAEAKVVFRRVLDNVELMLMHHRVHADLSAYNILYWDGAPTIIDFPQAVDPRVNRHAEALLVRDIERVCQYFSRYGVAADAHALAADLWSRYLHARL